MDPSCVLELHGGCTGDSGWFCRKCAARTTTKAAGAIAAAAEGGGGGAALPPVPSATPLQDSVAVLPKGYRFPIDLNSMTLPNNVPPAANLSGSDFGLNSKSARSRADTTVAFGRGWPKCTKPSCNGLLRPKVHMFSEDDHALLATLKAEEERYVKWECRMENAICGYDNHHVDAPTASAAPIHAAKAKTGAINVGDAQETADLPSCANDGASSTGDSIGGQGAPRLVLLELGCGLTVPSIRMEMECVLQDLTERLAGGGGSVGGVGGGNDGGSCNAIGSVSMIRINKDYLAAQNPNHEASTISIVASAAEALEGIDNAIQNLSGTKEV